MRQKSASMLLLIIIIITIIIEIQETQIKHLSPYQQLVGAGVQIQTQEI